MLFLSLHATLLLVLHLRVVKAMAVSVFLGSILVPYLTLNATTVFGMIPIPSTVPLALSRLSKHHAAHGTIRFDLDEALELKPDDDFPNRFIVILKTSTKRTTHMEQVKTLIADGVKRDGMESKLVLDGPIFEELFMYGGIFGPSVLMAEVQISVLVSIFGPGTNIPAPSCWDNVAFVAGTGTSEATAHTSGLVASLLSVRSIIPWTPRLMKIRIFCLAVRVPTLVDASTTNLLIQLPSNVGP
ncbi:hypothetical protein C8R43DRAFT_943225 [Mycena crocata]|nr:hypothetical protein C8R43DRAFT_943225 [Mycena crocata]